MAYGDQNQTKVRIAVLCWGGAKFLGVWNYYLNMAMVLREHSPSFRLVLFCPSDLPAERRREAEEVTGEEIHALPRRATWRDILGLVGYWDRDFDRRFRDAKIDVVFEQAKFLGRGFPIPVVSWIGDLQHRHLPRYFSRLHRLTRDVGFESQLRFRDHVIVSSQSAHRDILQFFAAPRAKIHVVPFAVSGPMLVVDTRIPDVCEKYGLREPYLFLPNQFWQHKNHELAFKAIHELNRRGRSKTLVLSGQSYDYRHVGHSDKLRALVVSLGIEPNLKWLGAIPHDDLLHLIAGADVLLNPSLFEGWSTTVEEAKCLGTPMALSALEVHREQAAGRAEFFDPTNAAAMADAIEAAAVGSGADRRARRAAARDGYLLDIQCYADRLGTAIRETIADHRCSLL
jgi:glycosyltransferase involved in cell wall biosynthesis